jgi:hypothetical protein
MATISATLNLGTVSPAITSVKLLSCPNSSCTGGTVITGFNNVLVSTFPRTVSGIPDTAKYIKVEGLGDCSSASQCIKIDALPGDPITPTPTATGTPTPTPTATPTPTLSCVTSVSFEVETAGEVRYVGCCGNTEYVNVGIGPQVISDCVQINSLFSTSASITSVSYSQTSCSCNTTPTPTPTATPNYYNITVNLVGKNGQDGNLQVYQSSDGISYQSSITLTSSDGNFATSGFLGTPGYYYYLIVARTSGGVGMNDKLNLYTQVNLSDFNPGPISNAWCTNSGNTLQSDPFQLPNPVQYRQSIIFYGGLNEGCL